MYLGKRVIRFFILLLVFIHGLVSHSEHQLNASFVGSHFCQLIYWSPLLIGSLKNRDSALFHRLDLLKRNIRIMEYVPLRVLSVREGYPTA